MNLHNTRIILWGCLCLLLAACGKDTCEDIGDQGETGSVSVLVKADLTEHMVNLTRAGKLPEATDFKVRIENTRGEVLRTWGYDTMPSLIKIVPGSYKLAAWYGVDALPAFELPYYYGETRITLKAGDNLDATVSCKLEAVKVAIKFDESFGYDYSDYSVDVKTTGDSLNFTKEEGREAYFQPGSLKMRFWLKPRGSEQTYVFYPTPIANVKVQEFYNITLKSKSDNGAAVITIQTDSSLLEIPVKLEIPPFYLAKPAPKISLEGFTSGGTVATTEGVSKPVRVLIASAGGLTELKLKTVSDSLLAAGWPAEVDLMQLTESQKNLLKARGLDWSDNLNTMDTIKTMVWVKFDDVIKLLNTAPGNTTDSEFELLAKDRFGQEGDAPCKLQVAVAPPVFEFVSTPGKGNVYARKVLYDIKYVSEVRKPVIEYQIPGGSWIPANTQVDVIEGDNCACIAPGLAPSTIYAFRVTLGNHILDAGTCTTEAILQVPNAEMEDWYVAWSKKAVWGANIFKSVTINYQQPSSSNATAYWSTINVKTGGGSPNVTSSFNVVPSTLSATGRSGLGARLQTIGWHNGGGNTDYGVGKAAAGRLFMGSYSYSHKDGPDVYNLGQPFASRPTSLRFYYKYAPYGSDCMKASVVVENRENGVVKIGEGVFVSGATVEAYTQQDVEIVYSEKALRATHMYIIFESSDKPDTEDGNTAKSRLKKIDNPYPHWHGSDLYIDDVELIY